VRSRAVGLVEYVRSAATRGSLAPTSRCCRLYAHDLCLFARDAPNLRLLKLVHSNKKVLPAEVNLGDAFWVDAGVADLAKDKVAECRLVEGYLRARSATISKCTAAPEEGKGEGSS
jgi:hypothetical protein